MADINQLIIEKGIEHWPVFAGVSVLLFAMWRWVIPNAVRSSLENGGGDAVRTVVNEALAAQDDRIDAKLKAQDDSFDAKLIEYNQENKNRMLEIISKHEELSRMASQNATLKAKNDADTVYNLVTNNLEELDERTTHIERKLKMKRRERVRGKVKLPPVKTDEST